MTKPLLAILLLLPAAASFVCLPSAAQILEAECADLKQFAAETNAETPINIDGETELLQVSVNCVGNMVSYSRRLINYPSSVLLDGWQERKQVAHTQLHCNREGLATKGIVAMDILHNPDGSFAAKFVTGPEDCQGSKQATEKKTDTSLNSQPINRMGIKSIVLGATWLEVLDVLGTELDNCRLDTYGYEQVCGVSSEITLAGYSCSIDELRFFSTAKLDKADLTRYFSDLSFRDFYRTLKPQSRLKREGLLHPVLHAASFRCGQPQSEQDKNSLLLYRAFNGEETVEPDRYPLLRAALERKYGVPRTSAGMYLWVQNEDKITLEGKGSVKLKLSDMKVRRKLLRDESEALQEENRRRLEDI